jgi:orotidine-5'-phosphate decarboxylase
MDAKRGDIGSTMDGYFDAWLGKTATFICDALTVSPYLGFDSLMPTLSAAHERGKGVFVLAATSNPEAKELQTSRTESVSVAGSIWIKLAKINKALDGDRMGSFGAVIGATINPQNFGIDFAESKSTPILAPGFGAQGVALSQFERLFGEASNRTIANVSRSISEAGAEMVGELILKAKSELRGHESNNYD